MQNYFSVRSTLDRTYSIDIVTVGSRVKATVAEDESVVQTVQTVQTVPCTYYPRARSCKISLEAIDGPVS